MKHLLTVLKTDYLLPSCYWYVCTESWASAERYEGLQHYKNSVGAQEKCKAGTGGAMAHGENRSDLTVFSY